MVSIVCALSMGMSPELAPYAGPQASARVVESLHGTVMAGYQGWFTAKGDGLGMGFVHWGGVDRDPPTCTVDMWPDLSEYGEDEQFETNFRYADGSRAKVFSSAQPKTVLRHFEWMRDYDIDGAFVQRFTVTIDPDNPTGKRDRRTNTVLANCIAAANQTGRAFAVMYDTDFDEATCQKIERDWTRLVKKMKILETNAYMHHGGAPVVALWGFGFDHRKFDATASRRLFEFLKRQENGGCTIMLGLPNDWVTWTGERKALVDEFCDIPSPWNVGRYNDQASMKAHFQRRWPADLAYCKEKDKDYLPVVFPGFSWTNLRNFETPLNQIPRRGGRFLWDQFEQVREYGMDMAYVAMFDEVDEGTAIFKVSNNPPNGQFVTLEGLPTDAYLQITRAGRALLRTGSAEFPRFGSDYH
jgi:hypothetical protein